MPAADERPYSPGLEGVIAGETSIALVDGANGRLLYRGYPIGELVREGTYAQVAELLWTGDWPDRAELHAAPLIRCRSSDAARTAADGPSDGRAAQAVSVWGAESGAKWPPSPDQARALTAIAPSALAAFARLRRGDEIVPPDPSLDLVSGFLYQLNGERPEPAAARALDAYFITAAEHSFNASTFTARVITSTRSDMASAVGRGDRRAQGPAARRCAGRSGQPAARDRLARAG